MFDFTLNPYVSLIVHNNTETEGKKVVMLIEYRIDFEMNFQTSKRFTYQF